MESNYEKHSTVENGLDPVSSELHRLQANKTNQQFIAMIASIRASNMIIFRKTFHSVPIESLIIINNLHSLRRHFDPVSSNNCSHLSYSLEKTLSNIIQFTNL